MDKNKTACDVFGMHGRGNNVGETIVFRVITQLIVIDIGTLTVLFSNYTFADLQLPLLKVLVQ